MCRHPGSTGRPATTGPTRTSSHEGPPDATAPLAAFYDAPILLTGRDELPPATRDTLAHLGVADVLFMGGPEATTDEVTNPLHIDYQVQRIAG